MAARELVLQSAVTLLATGKADQAAEALSMATQLLAELERALDAQAARRTRAPAARKAAAPARPPRAKAKPAAKTGATTAARPRPLPVRALRVLERLGVARPDAAPLPRELKHKVCEAHLLAAKGCGQVIVQQIAAWFAAHGEALAPECATWAEDWMTSRCDQPRRG